MDSGIFSLNFFFVSQVYFSYIVSSNTSIQNNVTDGFFTTNCANISIKETNKICHQIVFFTIGLSDAFILFCVTINLSDNLTEMCIVKNSYKAVFLTDSQHLSITTEQIERHRQIKLRYSEQAILHN